MFGISVFLDILYYLLSLPIIIRFCYNFLSFLCILIWLVVFLCVCFIVFFSLMHFSMFSLFQFNQWVYFFSVFLHIFTSIIFCSSDFSFWIIVCCYFNAYYLFNLFPLTFVSLLLFSIIYSFIYLFRHHFNSCFGFLLWNHLFTFLLMMYLRAFIIVVIYFVNSIDS